MPEATAQLNSQIVDKPLEVEVQLNGIRKGIGANSDAALGNKGIPHDPVPIREQQPQLPSFVPDGKTVNTSGQNVPVVEGSYGEFKTPLSRLGRLAEPLAFADRLVRGEHNVIDVADRFSAHKDEKEQKKLEHINKPRPRGPVERLIAWLHDEAA